MLGYKFKASPYESKILKINFLSLSQIGKSGDNLELITNLYFHAFVSLHQLQAVSARALVHSSKDAISIASLG